MLLPVLIVRALSLGVAALPVLAVLIAPRGKVRIAPRGYGWKAYCPPDKRFTDGTGAAGCTTCP